jgi:hypothetical protein
MRISQSISALFLIGAAAAMTLDGANADGMGGKSVRRSRFAVQAQVVDPRTCSELPPALQYFFPAANWEPFFLHRVPVAKLDAWCSPLQGY